MSTTFEKLQSKQIGTAAAMSKRVSKGAWLSRRNSFSYYVASAPTFDYGTIARAVAIYLGKRKNAVILKDIVYDVMGRKDDAGTPYKNYDSARRSIGRVVAQLVNWNFVTTDKNKEGLVTFKINRDNPVVMPKKH